MQTRIEYYRLLGFPDETDYATLTLADIKANYRAQALKFHPDKNKAPGAEEQFKKINEAYAYLQDLPIHNYVEKYPDFSFINPPSFLKNSAERAAAEIKKRKLDEAYQHVHGAAGFFNKALSFLAAFERICFAVMIGALCGALVAAAGAILCIPVAIMILVKPEKFGLSFSTTGGKVKTALAALLMLPIWGVLGCVALAIAAPIHAIVSTSEVYKEYAVRGMNRKEKTKLFEGAVILTTFVLGFFPALGIAAAFGMASLNPSLFNIIFGVMAQVGTRAMAFLAGKAYDKTQPCVDQQLLSALQRPTVAELEKLPRSTTANLLLTSPKVESVEPVAPQQVDFASQDSSHVALSLLKAPVAANATTDVAAPQLDSAVSLTA